jgi:hypothetical protein
MTVHSEPHRRTGSKETYAYDVASLAYQGDGPFGGNATGITRNGWDLECAMVGG